MAPMFLLAFVAAASSYHRLVILTHPLTQTHSPVPSVSLFVVRYLLRIADLPWPTTGRDGGSLGIPVWYQSRVRTSCRLVDLSPHHRVMTSTLFDSWRVSGCRVPCAVWWHTVEVAFFSLLVVTLRLRRVKPWLNVTDDKYTNTYTS